MKTMKIIHILNSLKYSGAEIMYVDAASSFQEQGCELSVLATATEIGEFAIKFEESGYDIYHRPYPSRNHLIDRIIYLIRLIFFLRKYNFDVVHIHSTAAMFGFAFATWVANKKSIYTFHNVFPTRRLTRPYHIWKRWIAKHLFKCTFQSISDSVYENELKIFKNDTIKIDNWYGSNRFYPADKEEKENIRQEIGLAEDAFVIISVGGCSHIKRHSEILRALVMVKKIVPNCVYLHLGEGNSLSEEKALVSELNLEENVLFLGNKFNVRMYLVISDLYVMTSKFEGISITTIEAMACEVPVILYDVPGLRDFNKSTKTCKLIKSDYHYLSQVIIDAYNNSSDLKLLVKSAKKLVDEKYNMKINSGKIFDLYHETK